MLEKEFSRIGFLCVLCCCLPCCSPCKETKYLVFQEWSWDHEDASHRLQRNLQKSHNDPGLPSSFFVSTSHGFVISRLPITGEKKIKHYWSKQPWIFHCLSISYVFQSGEGSAPPGVCRPIRTHSVLGRFYNCRLGGYYRLTLGTVGNGVFLHL